MTGAEVRHEDPMDPAGWPTEETPVTPGWRFVSIGFDGEATDVGGGVDPWTVDWGPTKGWIVTAHPSYPLQRHRMFVYELDRETPVVFAAGEFSNGVWGFFVPEDANGV